MSRSETMMPRTIFHLDMDAFYASVEQREEPAYKGKPVIVGADPKGGAGRGVVAACSYEARRFGIHSAMPIGRAYRLCPDGVYLPPDFSKYTPVSKAIRRIMRGFSDLVEPISIDEAFLDMSSDLRSDVQALEAAWRLKREIYQQQHLNASIGIAPNKMVSKIASDWKKPNGLFIVRPHEVEGFLAPLPVSKIWGVGPKTHERLRGLGVETIEDLRRLDKEFLSGALGKFGRHLWAMARGIDERPVVTERRTKSVSQETTFSRDVQDQQLLEETLQRQSRRVCERLKRSGLMGKTTTLKLRYEDFTTISRQSSRRFATNDFETIAFTVLDLLQRNLDSKRKVRLVGVGVSNLVEEGEEVQGQMELF